MYTIKHSDEKSIYIHGVSVNNSSFLSIIRQAITEQSSLGIIWAVLDNLRFRDCTIYIQPRVTAVYISPSTLTKIFSDGPK